MPACSRQSGRLGAPQHNAASVWHGCNGLARHARLCSRAVPIQGGTRVSRSNQSWGKEQSCAGSSVMGIQPKSAAWTGSRTHPLTWRGKVQLPNRLQGWLAMLHALTGTHIRPQGSVWLQSHTWPVPLLQPPLPDCHLLFTVQVPCEGRILLPQVITSIRGSQINISYDLSSLQEPNIGEWRTKGVGRGRQQHV